MLRFKGTVIRWDYRELGKAILKLQARHDAPPRKNEAKIADPHTYTDMFEFGRIEMDTKFGEQPRYYAIPRYMDKGETISEQADAMRTFPDPEKAAEYLEGYAAGMLEALEFSPLTKFDRTKVLG